MKKLIHTQTFGILAAIVAGICWGFSGTVSQYLLSTKDLNSGWITVCRLIISGLILLIIAALNHNEDLFTIWRDRKDAAHLLLFAIGGLMAVQYGYIEAIHYSNAGTATAIQYSGEILVLIYTCIVFRRKPKLVELLGLFLALFGIFLLATHGDINNMVLSTRGLIWGLIAAVALAAYTVIPGQLSSKYNSLTVTAYGMLIGGVVLFFVVRFWDTYVVFDSGVIIGMFLIITVGTALAFSLFIHSTVVIGPLKAGLIASIETVAAPFFSKVWLGTDFIWIDYIGFLCILVMVILLAVPELRAKEKEKEAE